MPSEQLPTHFLEDMSFVDVLADTQSGRSLGYFFGGDRPGPSALIVAKSSTIVTVSERLAALPTLPWMWGHLYLVAEDFLDGDWQTNVEQCLPDVTFNHVSLPETPGSDASEKGTDEAFYWDVLRICAGLGMIQGRGVNAQYN